MYSASRWSAIKRKGIRPEKTVLDTGRLSHGSRDRKGAVPRRSDKPSALTTLTRALRAQLLQQIDRHVEAWVDRDRFL